MQGSLGDILPEHLCTLDVVRRVIGGRQQDRLPTRAELDEAEIANRSAHATKSQRPVSTKLTTTFDLVKCKAEA